MGKIIRLSEKVDDLYLDLHVIGYWKEGESILFVLKSLHPRKRILFWGVIDSYKKGKKNFTIEMMKEYEQEYDITNRKLDFLCWTHPDIDHSKDMDILIEDYCDKETRIVIPPSLTAYRSKINKLGKKISDIISGTVNRKSAGDLYNYCYALPGYSLVQLEVPTSGVYNDDHKMEIISLSPFTSIIEKQYYKTKPDHNDFSIALLLKFDNLKIFLGSDIEKDSIELIRNEYILPDNFNYIKIPHHCSPTSEKFLEYLNTDDLSEIACTTTFNGQKLPDRNLLKRYNNYANKIYCTSYNMDLGYNYKENFKGEIIKTGKKDIGIVSTQFDLSKVNKVTYKVERRYEAARIK